ncbi:MAG: type II secretion system protein GspD, partial [Opitutaceae bacterium]
TMVTETGTVTINSLSGTVLVSDIHRNIETIAQFLGAVSESVVRQIDLEVEIYEVAFSDAFQLGIDWFRVIGNTQFATGLRITNPAFGPAVLSPSLTAEHGFGENIDAVLEALSQQGTLKVVSKPRLRTLNNQPAVVRVGQDLPVFIRQVTTSTGDQPIVQATETIQTITVGTILSITPQVSPDGIITLDITPAVSRLVRIEVSASGDTEAPVIDIRQASSIVRLRDGETIVMGGLVQDSEATTTRKVPILGDIPLLGRAFTGEADSTERTELVFFLTPRIVSVAGSDG